MKKNDTQWLVWLFFNISLVKYSHYSSSHLFVTNYEIHVQVLHIKSLGLKASFFFLIKIRRLHTVANSRQKN